MAAHLLNERIDDVIKSYQDSSVNEFLLIKRVEQAGKKMRYDKASKLQKDSKLKDLTDILDEIYLYA